MSAPKMLIPLTWQQFEDYVYVFGCPECGDGIGETVVHKDNCSLGSSAKSMEVLEKQFAGKKP